MGPRVLGFINLDQMPDSKKSRFKKVNEFDKLSSGSTKDSAKAGEKKGGKPKKPSEKSKEIFKFTIPGTIDNDVMVNLRHMYIKFRKTVDKNGIPVNHKTRDPVSYNIKKEEVIENINNQKDGPYKNISRGNAAKVAKAINSDQRFHNMFTTHAAMRLIDRYVDFNSDKSIESQCHNILDVIVSTLQKSFKEEVPVYLYEDKNHQIGMNLLIPETVYDKNAAKIFGTYPLRLGFCQKQCYTKNAPKEPLICTLYPQGI